MLDWINLAEWGIAEGSCEDGWTFGFHKTLESSWITSNWRLIKKRSAPWIQFLQDQSRPDIAPSNVNSALVTQRDILIACTALYDARALCNRLHDVTLYWSPRGHETKDEDVWFLWGTLRVITLLNTIAIIFMNIAIKYLSWVCYEEKM